MVRVAYVLKRLQELGPIGLINTLYHRFTKWSFARRYRSKGAAVHTAAPLMFFKDIIIPARTTADLSTMYPDIRMAWEDARLRQLSALGQAYQQTHDKAHAEAFQKIITTWLAHNPFLFGSNWVCPMEVAIRAINMIEGLRCFGDLVFPPAFLHQLTTSLHQHADYLAHNWEWSDKPNNHYLADLLGYAYLCFFFGDVSAYARRQKKIVQRFFDQLRQQINADGSSYEGSTAYHRLDTEMVQLFIGLCARHRVVLPVWVHDKCARMQQFLNDCTDQGGNLVTIGDDDSGVVVGPIDTPVSTRLTRIYGVTYPDFGLSIMKTNAWHITFRHPTFNLRQPTGHFHQDELAVTLSVGGVPVLVDPGSYVYTGNPSWRNVFRSWQSHNTFYDTREQWQDLAAYDLFQLPRKPYASKKVWRELSGVMLIDDEHEDRWGNRYAREISFNELHQQLTLADAIYPNHNCHPELVSGSSPKIPRNFVWRFVLHPAITVVQEDENRWRLSDGNQLSLRLESTMVMQAAETFFASSYGVKRPTAVLIGTVQGDGVLRQKTSITRG